MVPEELPSLVLDSHDSEDHAFGTAPGKCMKPPTTSPECVYAQSTSTSTSARNIVILLDGTSNQISSRNTNVIKMMSALAADETQLLYYSSGIGMLVTSQRFLSTY